MSFLNTRGLVAALFFVAAFPLAAADLYVTNLADSGPGSLRAALEEGNAASPANYPVFHINVSGVIKLESTLIAKRSVILDGGGKLTLDGQHKTGVLSAPCCYSGSLNIRNMTIANGYGGAVSYSEYSPLYLKNVTFLNNYSKGTGGAFYNPIDAQATVDSCTFIGNGAQLGGAIYANMNSHISIVNSTFVLNYAKQGGAIYDRTSSRIAIAFSTFFGNFAEEGGFLYQWWYSAPNIPTLMLRNTIISNNNIGGSCVCADLSKPCRSDGGGNLTYPDNTCPGTVAYPKLGPLADNGGVTKTMALLPGSPAIDAAANCNDFPDYSGVGPVVATDQRGVSRPQGPRCDIGAYERSPITFSGFHQLLNLPWINDVNAGRAIPIKFSVGGFLGMNIVDAGHPKSQPISCQTMLPTGAAATIDTVGSGLAYDSFSGTYSVNWKTEKSWEGSCRQFVLRLTDGEEHIARFRFR